MTVISRVTTTTGALCALTGWPEHTAAAALHEWDAARHLYSQIASQTTDSERRVVAHRADHVLGPALPRQLRVLLDACVATHTAVTDAVVDAATERVHRLLTGAVIPEPAVVTSDGAALSPD